MPAQESGEPDTPQEPDISIQTGVYTGMLIVAAVCMAAASAFLYFAQANYELGEGGKRKVPLHEKLGEAGLKSHKSTATEEPATEEKTEEAKPAEEKKEEAKPAEEKKEEAKEGEKPAEEKKEEKKDE